MRCSGPCRALLTSDLRTFRPQELANYLESFTQLNVRDVDLCDRVAREMQQRNLKKFPFHTLASVVKSFSLLGHRNPRLDSAIALEAMSRFSKVPPSSQSLIDLMWAFASLDVLKLPAVYSFFHLKYPGQTAPPSNAAQAAMQLLETQIAWKQSLVNYSTTPPNLLESMYAPQGWVQAQLLEDGQKRTVPVTCQQAELLLQDQYPDAKTGCTVLDGLPVDLLIKSRRTIVEVFDSADFFTDGVTLNGRVSFRQRLLLRANFRIYRLAREDFAKLSLEGQKKQIQHLVQLIEEESVPPVTTTTTTTTPNGNSNGGGGGGA